jgi:hypothetical protein
MHWSPTEIFGVPLNKSVLRAPATAILGGYRHDLALVVFVSKSGAFLAVVVIRTLRWMYHMGKSTNFI